MRRLFIFAIIALLGFGPLGILSVSAQSEGEAWQGVTVQETFAANTEAFQLLADFLGEPVENIGAGTMSVSARLDDVYPVVFENEVASPEHRAFIPEVQGAEFMVVIVASGEFVLDVIGPGSFLVDPVIGPELKSSDVQKVQIMHADISGEEVYYSPTEQFVVDEKGEDCTSLCTVLPGVAVQVTDGDRIIAPAGAICIWCLLNQNEHTEESEGQLYVFPLLDPGETFSWSQFDEGSAAAVEQDATAEANGYATPEEMTGAAPWAFFNPASNCRG